MTISPAIHHEWEPDASPSPRVWAVLQEALRCETVGSLGQTLVRHLATWPLLAKATLIVYAPTTRRPAYAVYHFNPTLNPAGKPVTLPVTLDGRELGWLALDPAVGCEVPPDVQADAQALVMWMAPLLARLQHLEAEQQQRLFADTLCAVSADIAAARDEMMLLPRILEHIHRLIPYARASLFEVAGEKLMCLSWRTAEGETGRCLDTMMTVDQGAPLWRVVHERAPLVVEQTPSLWQDVAPTRVSWLGVPLLVRGELWGIIAMEASSPHAFTPDHVQMAALFAEQVALALDNNRLYREERRRREELETIQRFNLLVAAELEFESLAQTVTQAARGLVQAQAVRLFIQVDQDADEVVRLALQAARPWCTPEEERSSGVRWVLPLHLGARVVGVLDVRWAPGTYEPVFQERLHWLAPQMAVALENARLYYTALEGGRRRAVLHAVGQEIISAVRDLPSLYAAIHRATAQLMPCDAFFLGLVTEDGEAIEVVYALDRGQVYTGVRAPRGQGLSWHVVTTGQALLMGDQDRDEVELGVKAIQVGEDSVRSLLFVPMRLEQRIFGVLSAQSYRPHAYQEDDITLLEMLAAQAAIAIENARLLQQTQRRAAYLETQNAIIAAATAAEDLPTVLHRVLDLVMNALQTPFGGIWIGEAYAVRGVPAFETVAAEAQAYAARLNLEVPLTVVDWQTTSLEGLRAQTGPFLMRLGFRSSLTIPIKNQGRPIGGMLVGSDQPRLWAAEEVALAETVGHQLGAVVRRLQLLAQVQEQAQELEQYSRSLEDQVRARTQELERAYQTMSEQHARLDAILRHITDGLVLTAPDGRIELVNPAFCAMVGREAAGLVGLALQEVLSYPPLLEALAQVQSMPDSVVTVDYHHAAQTYRCTSVALSGQGPLRGSVVTVLHDITADVEMARMKDDFVSTVSHELRTPMTSILGFSQLIGRQFTRYILPVLPEGDPQVQKAAARIQENLSIIAQEGARLTRLVNDVLDLAKMEAGRLEWKSEPFLVTDLIQKTLAALRSLIVEKRIAVRTRLAPDLPMLQGDPDRMIQVLTNLVGNALKFTDHGEIVIAAELLPPGEDVAPYGVRQPGCVTGLPAPYPVVMVSVTDSGPGIAEADMARLFQRFAQGGAQRGGSGLGLAICREIILHHRGAIWVESRLGEGSRFVFTLPLP